MTNIRSGWQAAARLALGAVFVAAALAKIDDPHGFALAVSRYRLLPGIWINGVAIFLPWLELLTGLAVWVSPARTRAAATLIILALLVVFTGAIGWNLARGIESSCGCFSTRADAAVSDEWNLLRNGALLWLAAVILAEAAGRARTTTPAP